jgi:hypothetical protein
MLQFFRNALNPFPEQALVAVLEQLKPYVTYLGVCTCEGLLAQRHFVKTTSKCEDVNFFATIRLLFVDFRSHIAFRALIRGKPVRKLFNIFARTKVNYLD